MLIGLKMKESRECLGFGSEVASLNSGFFLCLCLCLCLSLSVYKSQAVVAAVIMWITDLIREGEKNINTEELIFHLMSCVLEWSLSRYMCVS